MAIIFKWALVENGVVTRLVKRDNETTLLDVSTLPVAERRGWHEVIYASQTLNPWESFGARIETIDSVAGTVTISYAIVSVSLSDYQQTKISSLKKAGSAEIYRVAPPYKQDNVALGITGYEPSSPKATTIKTHIEATIAEIDSREAAILAATTHAEVDAVNITF